MKKLRSARPFLCGVFTTILVMGLVTSAFAVSMANRELYYNDIKIRLNGKTLTPKDAAGNPVEPFIIDGTTYLPVRAVGEALGLNVSWDGATNTVILGNDPEYKQPAAWLGEMETFTGSAKEEKIERDGQYSGDFVANNQETFDRYYRPDNASGTTYLLKGQYKTFTGTLYIPEAAKSMEGVNRILVYLDNKLVYTSESIGAGVEPTPFSVNVDGAYKMEIVAQVGVPRDEGIEWFTSFDVQSGWIRSYFSALIANAALWTD